MDSKISAALIGLAICILFLPTRCAVAQTSTDSANELEPMSVGRSSKLVETGLSEISKNVKDSVVEIFEPTQHLCLGTIVSKDGLVVTKASELANQSMQCRFNDGQFANLRLIATSSRDDLALLQIDMNSLTDQLDSPAELTPISFSKPSRHTESLKPGSFVVSIDSRNNQSKIGIISIEGQTFSIKNPECTDCVDFGLQCVPVMIRRAQPSTTQWNGGWAPPQTYETVLKVQRVYPRTIAEESKILVGDLIERVNGRRIYSQYELIQLSKTLKPGSEIVFTINRQNRLVTLTSTVSRHSKRIFHDRWGGGPFNRRRFGFTNVLTHDIPIQPDQCGSPLIDLHGQTVGINIARSLRVATLAIPIEHVQKFVVSVRPNAEIVMRP